MTDDHDPNIPSETPADEPGSPSWEVLDRYLRDEASPADIEAAEAHFGPSQRSVARARLLRDTLRSPQEYPQGMDVGEVASRILEGSTGTARTVQSDRERRVRLGKTVGYGWYTVRTLSIAAAAALLLALGVLFRGAERTSAPAQRYHTGSGQRSAVRLTTGSTALLAPETSVSITPQGIVVVGEAYFAITPHAAHPVVVQTENATVRVLGTKFVVRQYPGEPSRVVVEDGKVALRPTGRFASRDEQTVLSARMLAQITDSGVTVTSGIATRDFTGWTQGTLVFNRVELRDVLSELSRAYGTPVRVDDTLLAKRVMMMEVSVDREPLNHVLDVVGFSVDAHYTKDGAIYTLLPGRGATPATRRQQFPQQFPQPEQQYGR